MKRAALGAIVLAVALALPSSVLASSTTAWSLTGTYTIPFTCVSGCPSPPDYPYSITISATTLSTGAVVGTGYYIPNNFYNVTVTGQVTGSDVSLRLLYTDPGTAAVYNPWDLVGTIDPFGGMSGTAIDRQGRTFTWLTTAGVATLVPAKSHVKTDLVPYPSGPAVGAVIFNSSSGDPNNLELTVQLKKAAPGTWYDVYLFLDGFTSGTGVVVGTIATNGVGIGTLHVNMSVAPGIHTVAVDVTLHGSGNDVFVTPGLYGQDLFQYFK